MERENRSVAIVDTTEPVAYLKFWAAQYSMGESNIGVDEGLEVCSAGEIGMDGREAFPVYASPSAAAGSASPAAADDSYLRDASHPKDMTQAMEWIVGLRNRVDSLLDVINEREVLAHAGVGAEPAKQSIPHRLTLESIQGAICFGREGINPPPSDDHWLAEYWHIGRQLDKLGETSIWDNVTPIEGAAPSSDDVRNAALEEAAQAMNQVPMWSNCSILISDAQATIRALKSAAAQSVGDKKEQA